MSNTKKIIFKKSAVAAGFGYLEGQKADMEAKQANELIKAGYALPDENAESKK